MFGGGERFGLYVRLIGWIGHVGSEKIKSMDEMGLVIALYLS